MTHPLDDVLAILAGEDEQMHEIAARLQNDIGALGDKLFRKIASHCSTQQTVRDSVFVGTCAIAGTMAELIGFARRSVDGGADGDQIATAIARLFVTRLEQIGEADLLEASE